jgi:hypothetical protein
MVKLMIKACAITLASTNNGIASKGLKTIFMLEEWLSCSVS